MRLSGRVVCWGVLGLVAALGGLSHAEQSASIPARAYAFGSEVALPELIPLAANLDPPQACRGRFDGKVKLSLEIDPAGLPQKIMFIEPHFDDLDRLALKIAAADRFRPGTLHGAPVPILASLELFIKSCHLDSVDASGKKNEILRLRELPMQTLGQPGEPKVKPSIAGSEGATYPDISPPLALNSVVAQYSPEGRRMHISGNCMVAVIVDEHGMPKDPSVDQGLEPSMDQNALLAVEKYRFKPAIKDGTPIPVKIRVQIAFRLQP
jgi:TonB family protein